jgi:hypothetical protein
MPWMQFVFPTINWILMEINLFPANLSFHVIYKYTASGI